MSQTQKATQALAEALNNQIVDGWTVASVLGNGANGVTFKMTKGKAEAVMKVPLYSSVQGAAAFDWECFVMDKIIDKKNIEDRSSHLVRKISSGRTIINENNIQYLIMEMLPQDPVNMIAPLGPDEQVEKICEYGLQLLRGIYDFHQCGFLHRDIKPENIGGSHGKYTVMYDMGMARGFLDLNGDCRPPRTHTGMRGTEEWSSLNAELGRDQGRVDDMWAWLYVLNELINCKSDTPQVWSSFDSERNVRLYMKSSFFSARMILNNCPYPFFRILVYLKGLGFHDCPDYFYLATLLAEARQTTKRKQKPAKVNHDNFLSENKMLEHLFF